MSRSILIVDDNDDFLELLDLSLSKRGYAVHVARTGEEALSFLNSSKSIDLILLDVQMPDMTGVEFLDRLCERRQRILAESTIVYCSAGEIPTDHRVNGHINKMDGFGDVIASVRQFADA